MKHSALFKSPIFTIGIFAASFFAIAFSAIADDYTSTVRQASSGLGNQKTTSKNWSSALHKDPNHTEWIALAFDQSKIVNTIRLTPRTKDDATLPLPKYIVFSWLEDGRWNTLPEVIEVLPPVFGDARIQLSRPVNCTAVKVSASQLEPDGTGNYLFQIGEFSAGYSRPGQVYVGHADGWNKLLDNSTQWSYVAQNADGFYINFIEMKWITDQQNGREFATQANLQKTASFFKNKRAFFESDNKDNTLNDDKKAIDSLLAAGFTIPYTSLNYGWDAERARNLMNYRNTAPQRRLSLVQLGPWAIKGDIRNENTKTVGPIDVSNARYRAGAAQTDGLSTDGPMGLWHSNANGMRQASLSVIEFARGLHKQGLVMLAPYSAKVPGYTSKMYLEEGQNCVRFHEDAGLSPDVWAVFEYADNLPAVPEQIDGKAANSTTGMAYWLIRHLDDPERMTTLDVAPQTGVKLRTQTGALTAATASQPIVSSFDVAVPAASKSLEFTIKLRNQSADMDFCPIITAKLASKDAGWRAKYFLDGKEITDEMTNGGLVCVGAQRLLPHAERNLKIELTSAKASSQADLSLQLMPHPDRMDEVHQQLMFAAKSK